MHRPSLTRPHIAIESGKNSNLLWRRMVSADLDDARERRRHNVPVFVGAGDLTEGAERRPSQHEEECDASP